VITYRNPDAGEAERIAQQLASTFAADGAGETEPPTAPVLVSREYSETMARSTILGIVAGAIVALAFRLGRQPA
jgi:hypothetical protein